MIFHGNRIKLRDDAAPERVSAALDLLKRAGSENPVVRSYAVGQDVGGDHDCGAVFVVDDLEAYWEYLVHPAHLAAERAGIPLMARFESFDITDDPDPNFQSKVAELQRRHVETDPELAALMAALPENLGSSALPNGQ